MSGDELDGLTPLLPNEEENGFRRAQRKLKLLGVAVGCSVALDGVLCLFFSSGGFSSTWRKYLGINDSPFPLGSASLDLVIIGLLRASISVALCITLQVALRRRNCREPCVEETQEPRHVESAGRSQMPLDIDPSPLVGLQGLQSKVSSREKTSGNTLDTGSSDARGEGYGSQHSCLPHLAGWLEVCPPILCFLVISMLTAKCLSRLISGPETRGVLGLPTPWYWAAIGWSAAACFGEYLVVAAFMEACKRYWFLFQAREDGDLELALERDHNGGTGTGSRGEKHTATFADVLGLCAKDWPLILLAFAALLIASVSQVLVPHFTGNMIDNVVDTGDETQFRRSTLYLVLAAIVCGVFTGVRGGIFTVIGARVNVRVRQILLDSLVSQEVGFFDCTKTGELVSRLSSDCTKVGDQVTLNVNVFLRNLVQVVVTLLFMFYLSWRLSLVAFMSVPAIIGVSKVYGLYIRKLSKLSQDKLAEGSCVAEESLSSMPTVRCFAAERRESAQYAAKLEEFYSLNKKQGVAYGLYAFTSVVLPNLVTAVVLFYGGQLVMQGRISGGKVISFMIYLTTLSDGFNDMAAIFSSMTQAVGAADKVFELIKRQPKGRAVPPRICTEGMMGSGCLGHDVTTPRISAVSCKGRVEFKVVDFEYPSRPGKRVLDRLSFTAEAGQVLALVGPSGGGKSSCIALLENLYEPSRGEVLLDGRPVHEYDHQWLHRNVSIVGQEPTLYARSIRENVIYGLEDEEPSMEDIEQAARLANAHSFISQLPEKYDTQAGERGVQMSGGQKQRIAIARALVRKPRVLLLDEATSALDAESEHLVQQAIDNMIARGGMTVILIAHRLSTVKRADKIVVIRAGKVVEVGRHEDLVGMKGGVYAGLVKRQLDLGDSGSGTPSSAHSSRKTLAADEAELDDTQTTSSFASFGGSDGGGNSD